ncbi:MAG: hypothetical protein GY708_14190 [Actinomycetia bacterium]|nr:hypothetical protein [Actinomycetes bacterium]
MMAQARTNQRADSSAAILVWPTTGVIGLALGVTGLMLEIPAFGLGAGLCALAAGIGSLRHAAHTAAAPQDPEIDRPETGSVVVPSQTETHNGVLFSGEYYELAIRSQVTSARRFLRPVAVVRLRMASTGIDRPSQDPEVADIIGGTLRECDSAFVLTDHDISLILEDTPESGAIWVVERLRRALTNHCTMHVWAGVACYPAHAMDTTELQSQAEDALTRAREWPQDRIEVAFVD